MYTLQYLGEHFCAAPGHHYCQIAEIVIPLWYGSVQGSVVGA